MIPIRLDDLGASTKQFEWWSRHRWANVWPLHHRRLFGAWGPYRELTEMELEDIIWEVHRRGQQITLAITACWVERDGTLVPYGRKFPDQADVVRRWARVHVVIVAAHGTTHCVPKQHLPRWVGGNRPCHREQGGVARAMSWLERDLGVPVTRYVAPGERAGTTNELVFHDRDFVLDWKGTMRKLHEALA